MILPSTEPIQSNNDDSVNNLTNTMTVSTTVTSTSSSPSRINTHTTETCDTNVSSVVDSSDDDLYYETQPRSLAALAERDRRREQLYLQKLAKKQQQQQQSVNTSTDRNVLVDSRDGVSIQANAIDSSSAMIVNENRVSLESNNVNRIYCGNNDINNRLSAQQKFNNKTTNNKSKNLNNTNNKTDLRENYSNRNSGVGVSGSGAVLLNGSGDNKSDNNNSNKNQQIKMDHKSNVSAINVPVSSPQATSKSASLPTKMNNFDKKSTQKPGFLSRFTNFRFSLRGSKKKLKSLEHTAPPSNAANNIVLVSTKSTVAPNNHQHGESVVDHVPMRNKSNNNHSRAGYYQRNSMRSNEFEYIPLKDPIAVVFDTPNQTSDKNVDNVTTNTAINAPKNATKNFKNDNTNNNNNNNNNFIAAERKNAVVTSKPPLPRQPPRVVGVCAKQASTLNSTHPSYYQSGSNNKAATLSQSNPQREGVKRHAQQQRSTSVPPREINFNSSTDNGKNFHYLANQHHDDDDYQFLSSRQTNESYSRGGLLKGAVSSDGLLMDVNENSFCTGDEDDDDDDGKIGLIETNLDTDETVISGKTRSLMELGPQMANRTNGTTAHLRIGGKHGAKGNDPTTIEPRRPHKSMEFLLDKENQRFVLVSFYIQNLHYSKIISPSRLSLKKKKRILSRPLQ